MAAKCPKCGAAFTIETVKRGGVVVCSCGARLRVPPAGPLRLTPSEPLPAVGDGARKGSEAAAAPAPPQADSTAGPAVAPPVRRLAGTEDLPDAEAVFVARAVEREMMTVHQVEACVSARRQLKALGVDRPIEEIVAEKGFLTGPQIGRLKREIDSGGELREFGGFRITGRLGKGGMGTVYKARQVSLDRDVALKVLPPSLANDESFVQRFISEARTAARLHHPNIVQAIDVGCDRGIYYFAMELIEGSSVGAVLAKRGKLSVTDAVTATAQVARALEHAWDRARLIHRDIKPDNILIDHDGTAKLADLGLAKSSVTDANASVSSSGAVVGTPNYISPEQAQGDKQLDPRSDIYSLGCTLFHMLTGEKPYNAENPASALLAHLTQPVPDARLRDPGIPEKLAVYLMKMMAKSPEHRPQTAGEVADFMERFLIEHEPELKEPSLIRLVAEMERIEGAPAAASGEHGRKAGLFTQRMFNYVWFPLFVVIETVLIVAIMVRPRGEPAAAAPPQVARGLETQSEPLPPPLPRTLPQTEPAADGPGARNPDGAAPAPPAKEPEQPAEPGPAKTAVSPATGPAQSPAEPGKAPATTTATEPAGPAPAGPGEPKVGPGQTGPAKVPTPSEQGPDAGRPAPGASASGVTPGTAAAPAGPAKTVAGSSAAPLSKAPGKTAASDGPAPPPPVGPAKEPAAGTGPGAGHEAPLEAKTTSGSAVVVRPPIEPPPGKSPAAGETPAVSVPVQRTVPAAPAEGRVPLAAAVLPESVKLSEAQTKFAALSGLAPALDAVMGEGVAMRLMLIPPGEFQMGSRLAPDEQPVRRVRISRPFYLGACEVTNAQYRRFRPSHRSGEFKGLSLDEPAQPVVNVSWNDAVRFCAWMAERTGRKVRLPTEAEWEYACRAGTTGAYYWGDDAREIAQYANLADLSARKLWSEWSVDDVNDGFAVTAPVGRLKPNAFGLYDMLGNVWEWCGDWYGELAYAEGPKDDPKGPGEGVIRVFRGGSWFNQHALTRCAVRGGDDPAQTYNRCGFRIVVEVEEP